MERKQTLITPIKKGLVSQQTILVEKSVWQQLAEAVIYWTKTGLALIGFLNVVSWFFWWIA